MASISSLGVGSGLDLSSILESLTAAQKATLTPISNQQSSFTAKLSAYGTLKSALTTFQTANTALSKADLFSATSTTSSTTAFSATTAGNAIAGKYTISVTHLAQAQTLTTRTTRDDTKTAIATSDSKLTIQQGGDKDPISQSSSNGALLGDSTLRTIQTQLKSMLSNTVSSSNYKTLAQIGITTDPSDGKLELDADKLTAALKKDASGVGALIVGDGKKTGITTTIGSNLTSWLSTTGIIKAATDGVSKTLNKLTKDYNAASDRIDAQVARYKEQFTQLDVLMTSLNSTSSYLTQQFENNSNSK
ncbi:flagellar filament capping protein FliD [Escherichia coli]|nr:flagellar filament capping protein FliD [Escherichia coli]MCV9241253.1 flagellar filament capping protein FliD [Escherichia coli]HAI4875483.1 flagellar filament capping protein FliD [Escherichia coli]